jgi:hypothetical protein
MKNHLKTFVLLGSLSALVLGLGFGAAHSLAASRSLE